MRVRPLLREVALFLLFAAFAIALTWPLAANLRTALSDLGDPLLNTWILDWDLYAFAHRPLHLFDAPIYAPAKYPLAYSENMVGIALLMAPFHAGGATPIALYNIALLLGFAMSGYGMSVLARTAGRSMFASIVAGILFAFCGFKFEHLAHLQIIWSGWLPLLLAALLAYWRMPTGTHAFALAAAFVMNGLTNIHWLLFGGFALLATATFLGVVEPRRDRRFWILLAGALLLGAAILLPFLMPYNTVAKLYGMVRDRSEVAEGSAHWGDWLMGAERSLLYGRFWSDIYRPERKLFPGAVAAALAVAGIFLRKRRTGAGPLAAEDSSRKRALVRALDALVILFAIEAYLGSGPQPFNIRIGGHLIVSINNAVTPLGILTILLFARFAIAFPSVFGEGNLRRQVESSRFSTAEWSAVIWIVLGLLGSLGLNFYLHSFLFAHVRAFQSIRTPARWAILAYVGIALFAAAGADALGRHGARPALRVMLQAVILVLAVADVLPRIQWEQQVEENSAVYTWLKEAHVGGSILELPMTGWNLPFPYLLASTIHHVPIMNGTSGFEPPLHRSLRTMTERGEYNSLLTMRLENNGCQLVVVHPDWLLNNTEAARAWIRQEMASGRLVFLRRFDGGANGDYVFAIPANLPDWQRFRQPVRRDGAGFTDDENLQRMLAGLTTYSARTFGRIESPQHGAELHGVVRVRGWALSPHGIASVVVRVHSGTRLFRAELEARPDVSAPYPFYPQTPRPGFVLDLRRPKGVPRDTDIQIEITDGAGNVIRLPDRLVTWD